MKTEMPRCDRCDSCMYNKSHKHSGYTFYCTISEKDVGQSHFGMNSPKDCPKRDKVAHRI